MALGTIASRATGFLRIVVIAAALGLGGRANPLPDAYAVPNVMPNIIYELLLGGVLTSVIVPVLVRSARDDGDEGTAFAQALLSMVVTALTALTLLAMVLAPWLLRLYSNATGRVFDLEVTFLRFFLPQIVFYGAGAAIGAVLNTRGRFGPPMFAPVLNNIVVIATFAVFAVMPGPDRPTAATISGAQVAVLAFGTTLGVIAMTLALLPALHSTGFRWRWRFDWRHPGLRAAARLAGWVFAYVAVNQVGYTVVVNLAGKVEHRYNVYFNAFQLFQLPHAIVTVSVITALLPLMSRHAADGRLAALGHELSRGLRMSLAFVVPAAVGYLALGRPIAVLLFAHGQSSPADAALLGHVLMGFAVGLAAFTAFQLQLRGFYAMHDTKTPAVINIAVNAVMVATDVVLFHVLHGDARLVGLALGYAASYAVGVGISTSVLRRRLGGMGGAVVLRLLVRAVLAAVLAAVPAYALSRLAQAVLGNGKAGSALAVAVGAGALGGGYLALARRLRIRELDELLRVVARRFAR
ncbi:MAG: putative peptidoglycan lipid flippase [Frankiaceae bacterium]|nr:putative peptidoglycan lipid flippase [Frankiaceae bacterium]